MKAGEKHHWACSQLRSTTMGRRLQTSSRLLDRSFPCRPVSRPPPRTVLLGFPIPSTAKWWEKQNPASPPPFRPPLWGDCQVTSNTGGRQAPARGWFPLQMDTVRGGGTWQVRDPEPPEGTGRQGCVFSCGLPAFSLPSSPAPARVTGGHVSLRYVTRNTRKRVAWLPKHVEVPATGQPLYCSETHLRAAPCPCSGEQGVYRSRESDRNSEQTLSRLICSLAGPQQGLHHVPSDVSTLHTAEPCSASEAGSSATTPASGTSLVLSCSPLHHDRAPGTDYTVPRQPQIVPRTYVFLTRWPAFGGTSQMSSMYSSHRMEWN